LDRLVNARPPIIDDMITGETIASMTSGRPTSGDGLHILIMDLHKELRFFADRAAKKWPLRGSLKLG
jgi:hypothetical protein